MHLAWQQLEYDHVSRDFGKQLGCLVKEEQEEEEGKRGCELKEREGGKTKEAPSNKAQRMSLLDSLSRSPAAMASTLAT